MINRYRISSGAARAVHDRQAAATKSIFAGVASAFVSGMINLATDLFDIISEVDFRDNLFLLIRYSLFCAGNRTAVKIIKKVPLDRAVFLIYIS